MADVAALLPGGPGTEPGGRAISIYGQCRRGRSGYIGINQLSLNHPEKRSTRRGGRPVGKLQSHFRNGGRCPICHPLRYGERSLVRFGGPIVRDSFALYLLAPFLPVRRRWVEDIATRVSDCITPGFCGCVKTMKSKALQSRSSISSYRF